MRLPSGHPRLALFGIASFAALSVASGRGGGVPAPVATAGVEERAVVAIASAAAAADGHTHVHVSGSSVQFAPDDEQPLRATPVPAPPAPAMVPLSAAGAPVDGPRSTVYAYGDRTKRRVSLTFDAGADVGYAADILDTLARERAVASFGMTGAWAEQHPALVKRMVAEGHHLMNHTWSHGSLTGHSTGGAPKTRAQRWDELDRTEAVIQRIAGISTLPYFRPPYGDLDASVLADVGARGYTVTAMWAVDSLGWNGLPAPRIEERTLRLTTPGAILVFHVGSRSQDAAALPAIIRGLRTQGYEFVSVATLAGGP